MVRKTSRLTLVVALACFIAPIVPAVASAQSHPSLLFGAGDVQRLQSQAQTTHAPIYAALKTGTDSFLGTGVSSNGTVTWQDGRTFNLGDLRDIGTALIVYSFVWQIDGGDTYYTLAHNWLMEVASWSTFDLDGTQDLVQGCILTGVALAYDMLYPRLSDGERAKIQKVLAANAQALMQGGLSGVGRWWETEYLQNHNWIDHESIGFAALALAGELPDSTTRVWLDFAVENAKKTAAATSGITDGTWHEGLSYLSYAYMWHLPFVTALKRNGHEDLTDVALLHANPSFVAHQQIPDAPNSGVLTYGDFFGFFFDVASLRYAASHFGDGVAQAAADRVTASTARDLYAPELASQVYEFLFYDPSVVATDLHKLPLDWYGSDLQAVVFRSSWDKGATLFGMKSGTYGGRSIWERFKAGDASIGKVNFGHDHADDNGFYLYANGSWLAPEAEGYGADQASFTALHNTLTVDGMDQLGAGPKTKGDEAQSYDWFAYREASIPFQGSSDDFSYAIGNGAHLYPASLGLDRWDRHVLFLDRKWVILRDVLESSLTHDYSWFCHFMESASREGSWIHGRGENGQSLGVAVVAPADWKFAASSQSPPKIEDLNPKGAVTAATVRPGQPSPKVNFLTALVPVAEAGWGARPVVAALDTAAPDQGLTLVDGERVAAAVFARQSGDEVRAGDFHLLGQAGVAEYQGGVPDRALLVQGTLLEDLTRRIIEQTQPVAATLEANGLGSDVVTFSGDALGIVKVYAPKATRVVWYGQDVSFQRQGDYVKVNQSPPLSGQQAAGKSASAGASSGGGGCSNGDAGFITLAIPLLLLAWRRRSIRARLRAVTGRW